MQDEPNSPCPQKPTRLSDADAQALNELLDLTCGQPTTGRLADTPLARSSPRHQGVARLLDLIGLCPAEAPSADLAKRTLKHVAERRHEEDADRDASVLGSLSGPLGAGSPFRWTEILATAAAVLIAFSLLWPALDFSRAQSRRIVCSTNLAAAGSALANYAGDHQGLLPRSRTRPGAEWWHVGDPSAAAAGDQQDVVESNSAHLYLLARQQYLDADILNCPDNPEAVAGLGADRLDWPSAAAVSYSYQNQYTPEPLHIRRVGAMPVLADKNPLFVIRSDRTGLDYASHLPATSPSVFHRRLGGQNVLAAAGSVAWMRDPIVRRTGSTADRSPREDNIWLVTGIDDYEGNETPAAPDDAFLVP